jgi:hypothetical protein
MADYVFRKTLSNHRQLCISPLPDQDIERALPLTKTNRLSYYLYEMDESSCEDEVVILARLVSEDAALRLRDALRMEYAC